MASSSNTGSIDTDLQAALDWVPPVLSLTPGRSLSRTPRKPAFYDKHLSDRVVLKHVKSMPSLISDIAGVVDQKLKAIQDSREVLPPFGRVLSAENIDDLTALMMSKTISNELSLTELYSRTTAIICERAASTLALYPRLKTWHSVFKWDMATVNHTHAIAHGALRILNRPVELGDPPKEGVRKRLREAWDSLGQETETLLRDLQNLFPDLAIWEFKSIPVGDDTAMKGIENEASTDILFRWTTCKSAHLFRLRKHESIKPDIGPDADLTPWTIQPSGPSEKPLEHETSAPSRSSTPEGPKAKKRKRGSGDTGQASYQSTAAVMSEGYLQQAWAEAVHADATLIILNSGNYEYVAVRHRATQTLYVSELIQPHALQNPGYGKLHIGIYIAAYNDAADRLRKIKINSSSNDGNNDGGEDRTGGDGEGRDKKGKGRDQGGSRGGRGKGGDGGQDSEALRGSGRTVQGVTKGVTEIDFVQTKELLSEPKPLHVYLRFAVYNSQIPATFVRVTPSTPAKHFTPTPLVSPEEHLTLVLSSELGEGATGVVHGGQLEVETLTQHVILDVVAKLAFTEDQRESLKHEFSIYCLLASEAVKHVPTALGLFEDVEDGALALILTPAGVPVAKEDQLSTDTRQDFQAALAGIHHVGILHGDIRRQNLLINDNREVAIIDFDQSRKTSSSKAREKEMKDLVDLLD